MVILNVVGYLGEIESDTQDCLKLRKLLCIVQRSALPIVKSPFAVVEEIPLSTFWLAR